MIQLPSSRAKFSAFTLVELLVAIAIVGILAALILSGLAGAKRKGPRIVCLNRLKQLQTAWAMYVHDHEDKLPENSDQPQAGRTSGYESWVAGWLRSEFEPGDKSDATNLSLLTGTDYEKFGSIGQYLQNPTVYKCPLDKSRVTVGGISHERIRTVSMNAYMNGVGNWQHTNYVTFRRMSEIANPSDTWVLIEEREDSINDGYFAVLMESQYSIVDTPGNYHDNGAVLSFADGHVEWHKWLEPSTTPPLRPGYHLSNVAFPTSAHDRDMKWLTERTTVRAR